MPDPASTILFSRRTPALQRPALRAFAQSLTAEVAGGREFTCLLTSDRALQRLNREFLSHDYATDVLSFPSGSGVGPLGDIAISLERAEAQAAEFGHGVEVEVRVLMLHGLLHLLGHDHERDGGKMKRLETRWRRHYGLPAGLIERVCA
jgi:probable rRNA maturation factor